MATLKLVVVVLLASVLVGCGEESLADDPAIGTIEYGRGGGFAGIGERLRVEPNGSAEFVVERGIDPPDRYEFSLDSESLAELDDLLAEYPLDSVPEPRGSECADCFGYSISYGGAGVSGDDTTFPEAAEPPLAALADVVDKNVPSRLVYPYPPAP